jgi:hypothetical protein
MCATEGLVRGAKAGSRFGDGLTRAPGASSDPGFSARDGGPIERNRPRSILGEMGAGDVPSNAGDGTPALFHIGSAEAMPGGLEAVVLSNGLGNSGSGAWRCSF